MKIYLDMCALKRPFDDQRQGRILIETAAVTRILEAAASGTLTLCNSAALAAENCRNPNPRRRARVETLLDWVGKPTPATRSVLDRAEDFARQGIRDMDALHLAFAEALQVDWFVTVDDHLLSRAASLKLGVPVTDVIEFVREQKL
ncbi:MAG: type II toxin-antitoxin system VapC family toxin [Verrucomicrobia bacterium]|nr:type II toxin-antitoxin system VapC family toxin [Verrucomicrobiota bacterium]